MPQTNGLDTGRKRLGIKEKKLKSKETPTLSGVISLQYQRCLFLPVPQPSSVTWNFPMQKPVISGTISCSPLLQSSQVFGKYKVFKMGMRKTRLSKSPVTVCYPGKGQHELTASTDLSRWGRCDAYKGRGESQMLEVDSKAKDQGGWGLVDRRLDSPRLRGSLQHAQKWVSSRFSTRSSWESYRVVSSWSAPQSFLSSLPGSLLSVLTSHHHIRCSLRSAVTLLCR